MHSFQAVITKAALGRVVICDLNNKQFTNQYESCSNPATIIVSFQLKQTRFHNSDIKRPLWRRGSAP